MDGNFSLGIVIGATLSSSLGSAFRSLENKFKSLEQKSQNLKLTKALSHKLKSYEASIRNLEKQREEYLKLGKSIDSIERKLEVYRQKLKGVKLEAIKAGISIRDLRQDTLKLGKALDEVKKKTRLGEISGKITTQGAKLGAVATTGFMTISTMVKPAIDFESAFADVKKVVDFASKEQEKQFRKTILDMSTKIPLSVVELSQIAAQGGQLGIDVKDLPQFTELVAKMATAFDMVPEQAGEAFAKLSNVYGLSMKEAEELGDAINALGNNTAAKERDIINTLGRIGGIAKQFGLAKEGAAALSAAFIALGKPPEVAATSINALLGKLNTIETQSPKFKQAFEKVMPIEDFKRLKKENPEKALINFLHRLKQFDKETQANLIAQMFGAEYSDDIALLIGSLDQYAKALDIVSDKEKYKGALEKEFEARSKTTANNLKLLQNKLNKLAIIIGSYLLPPLNKVIDVIGNGITIFTKFTEEHETLGKAIAFGTVAIFGLITASLSLSIAFNIAKMSALMLGGSFKNLWLGTKAVGKAFIWAGGKAIWFGRIGMLALVKGASLGKAILGGLRIATILLGNAFRLTPFGVILTGIGLLIGAGTLLIQHWDTVKKFFGKLWEYIKQGFSLLGKAIGKIIENSPLGMAFKAGKWIFGKISSFFGKSEDKKEEVINKSETKKEENIQKTEEKKAILDKKTIKKVVENKQIKIEFGPIKIDVSGKIEGVNTDELAKKVSQMLEEKLNRKVEQVLRSIKEDEFRRAY